MYTAQAPLPCLKTAHQQKKKHAGAPMRLCQPARVGMPQMLIVHFWHDAKTRYVSCTFHTARLIQYKVSCCNI